MISSWRNCKNILIIRPDNMGDVIMMTPALRALKDSFGCRITLLTSQMGSVITPHISYIDETLIYNLPWINAGTVLQPVECLRLIEKLKAMHFDGAIISTVYSQNPLPAAMLAFMAGIPLRLAYCRENPYELLTNWIPDKEPYTLIRHQIPRELNLVAHIGALTDYEHLSLSYNKGTYYTAINKLILAGVDADKSYIIMHPGVSEAKRKYPEELWIQTTRLLLQHTGKQILLTGSADQKHTTDKIQKVCGTGVYSFAGELSIEEFIALIDSAQLVISVNTATVHIAAATNTPVIVLYALTNPQHTPWKVPSVVMPFSVPGEMQSKNEVIQYVGTRNGEEIINYPNPEEILQKAIALMATHPAKEQYHEAEQDMLPL